ncbi:MAG: nicotinate (nicotinamide) nucleotide adenylyltransferase [Gemmatimonadales bacterium]|nr:nicotinate (nicotinamide) nucleotide adenylyltransferase [Gemmatimonadales bacterium]
MPSIGLLGGSFDPVHHGHLIVGQIAAETLGLDVILFLPARQQPFKLGRHAAAAVDRAAMLDLAVAAAPGFAVERAELERPAPSFSVDTLEALRAKHPGATFTLLLGADAAAELEAWHRAADLPGLARIVVFGRPGTPIPTSPLISATVEVPAVQISATEIRQRVRTGRPIRYWVPDAVAEYVTRHRLYLDPE